jgi:hypothetical protein
VEVFYASPGVEFEVVEVSRFKVAVDDLREEIIATRQDDAGSPGHLAQAGRR